MTAAVESDADRMLTVKEVSRRLALSRSKVYSAMDAGDLAYCKFGKSRRIPEAAVEEYVRRSTISRA